MTIALPPSCHTRRRLVTAGSALAIAAWLEHARAKPPGCVLRPQQSEGPYFRDARLNRSDIRGEPGGPPRPGRDLWLELRLMQVMPTGCAPLPGALVDVWHCDAQGAYSATGDGSHFLRGNQVSDRHGQVRFRTIFPGGYPGRAVHIHLKVRRDPEHAQGNDFTSQLYFDDALVDRVHAAAPYARRGARGHRNDEDSIFRHGGKDLLLVAREGVAGELRAALDIGLADT